MHPVAVQNRLQALKDLIRRFIYADKFLPLLSADIVYLLNCGGVFVHELIGFHHKGVFADNNRINKLRAGAYYLVCQYLKGDNASLLSEHSLQNPFKCRKVALLQHSRVAGFLCHKCFFGVHAYYLGFAYLALVNGKFL